MIVATSLLLFFLFIVAIVPCWIAAYKDHPTCDKWGRRK